MNDRLRLLIVFICGWVLIVVVVTCVIWVDSPPPPETSTEISAALDDVVRLSRELNTAAKKLVKMKEEMGMQERLVAVDIVGGVSVTKHPICLVVVPEIIPEGEVYEFKCIDGCSPLLQVAVISSVQRCNTCGRRYYFRYPNAIVRSKNL